MKGVTETFIFYIDFILIYLFFFTEKKEGKIYKNLHSFDISRPSNRIKIYIKWISRANQVERDIL